MNDVHAGKQKFRFGITCAMMRADDNYAQSIKEPICNLSGAERSGIGGYSLDRAFHLGSGTTAS
jgi:hypothetical protein